MKDYIVYSPAWLLSTRHDPPIPDHEQTVTAMFTTLRQFFEREQLLQKDAVISPDPKHIEFRMAHFTEEAQAFLRGRGVEKWMTAGDRKGAGSAYWSDPSPLERHLSKFRAS